MSPQFGCVGLVQTVPDKKNSGAVPKLKVAPVIVVAAVSVAPVKTNVAVWLM